MKRRRPYIIERLRPPDAPPTGDEHFVPGDGTLQAVVDSLLSATTPQIITVDPGTYPGLTLQARAENSGLITIRSAGAIPAAGVRIGPSDASACVKLQGTLDSNRAGIVVNTGSHNWNIVGAQILQGSVNDNEMVQVGSELTTDPAQAPNNVTFDRCLLLPDPARGQHRGITLQSRTSVVKNCYISDIWYGNDNQCITTYNGPGPFTIDNNYLMAASQCFMSGGSKTQNANMMLRDLTFSHNLCTKKLSWKTDPGAHTVKNAFELKEGVGAHIFGNVFENCWTGGQDGQLFTPSLRNQSNSMPWGVDLSDIVFEYNVLRHAGAGMQCLGHDYDYVSARGHNWIIRHNLMYNISTVDFSGTGRMFTVQHPPFGLEFYNNTQVVALAGAAGGVNPQPHHSMFQVDQQNAGPGCSGYEERLESANVHDNVFAEGIQGLACFLPGVGMVRGNAGWIQATVNSTFTNNVVQRSSQGAFATLPAGNVYTDGRATGNVYELAIDPATYRVIPAYARAGLGCDIDTLLATVKDLPL